MERVVLCSSRKFRNKAHAFLDELEKLGVKVYKPPLKIWSDEEWNNMSREEQRLEIKELTYNHLKKIDIADAVFVYNQDGYAGASVSLEMGYAFAEGKQIYALERDKEHARDVLYSGYASTPKELVKLLK